MFLSFSSSHQLFTKKNCRPFFIHLEMLRLELALDDFVSRALADDDVRKAMESATAEGYSGPALQAVFLLTKKRGLKPTKQPFFEVRFKESRNFFHADNTKYLMKLRSYLQLWDSKTITEDYPLVMTNIAMV